jgi:hypothetical protein
MNNLIANRAFIYSGTADEVKRWLHNQGYTTEDVLGEYNQVVVFKVIGTAIKVGCHQPVDAYDGRPMVHLLNDPHLVETEPETAQRGIALYQRLYRKFREQKLKGGDK